LPCEVAAVIQARCAGCHGVPPMFGAPMPLAGAADFQATARDGRTPVWQMAKTRISTDTMPPRSATPLSPTERATLMAWIDQGAPAAAAGTTCGAAPPTMPPPGPGQPPGMPPPDTQIGCTPNHTFTSQGANPAEGFPVPAADNHHQCFNLPVPFERQEQAIAWAPVIGDARVVHHWILYAVRGTSTNCSQSKRFIFGWAPGGKAAKMPPNIGHELPNNDERMLLEVHYANPMAIPGIKDRTGVAICTIKTPRPTEAGVISLGNVGFRIPPRARDYVVTGNCGALLTSQLAEPLHVLASFPHMHRNGTAFKTTLTAQGKPSATVVEVKKWDFYDQVGYWHDHEQLVVNKGDSLTTTCTYTNNTDQAVSFGENTENEMCFNFMTVYPISAVRFLDTRPLRLCAGF
jgi:hypothetical protein